MKTIAIIGGMGPRASLHAHKRLVDKLAENNINANIVHISLSVEHFFDGSGSFILIKEQKKLLSGIKADIGFIACNTAHHFFRQFQDSVQFELINILETAELPNNGVIFCSPLAKRLKLFGDRTKDETDEQTKNIGDLIKRVNSGEVIRDGELRKIVGETKLPIFACTEISMLAFNEKLEGLDTLEQTIDEVIRRIK